MKNRGLVAIFNPRARHGRAEQALPRITAYLHAIQSDMPIQLTRGPGHAVELARKAAQQADIVVAIGGDGTVHEVANGLLTSGSNAALGIVPFGTGNDYVKMTKTPLKIEAAVKILEKGKRKAVDCGTVAYQTVNEEGRRYFINTAGIGLDAEVGFLAASFKALPGFTAYLAALFQTLRQLNTSNCELVIENEGTPVTLYRGPLLLCSFGNGQSSGGLFRLTPSARFDDGLLDVCLVESIPVPRIVRYVPAVLRGTHGSLPICHMARGEGASITVDPGLYVHADGEIVAARARRVDVRLLPKRLSVICP